MSDTSKPIHFNTPIVTNVGELRAAFSEEYEDLRNQLATAIAELAKSKERERQLDSACKRQQQRNRYWFRSKVLNWIVKGWIERLEFERKRAEAAEAKLVEVQLWRASVCGKYQSTGVIDPNDVVYGLEDILESKGG